MLNYAKEGSNIQRVLKNSRAMEIAYILFVIDQLRQRNIRWPMTLCKCSASQVESCLFWEVGIEWAGFHPGGFWGDRSPCWSSRRVTFKWHLVAELSILRCLKLIRGVIFFSGETLMPPKTDLDTDGSVWKSQIFWNTLRNNHSHWNRFKFLWIKLPKLIIFLWQNLEFDACLKLYNHFLGLFNNGKCVVVARFVYRVEKLVILKITSKIQVSSRFYSKGGSTTYRHQYRNQLTPFVLWPFKCEMNKCLWKKMSIR
jgi:hypothetical protein